MAPVKVLVPERPPDRAPPVALLLTVDNSKLISIKHPRHFPVVVNRIRWISQVLHELAGDIYEDIKLSHRGTPLESWRSFDVADWFSTEHAFFVSSRVNEAASMSRVTKEEVNELSTPISMAHLKDPPFYVGIVNTDSRPRYDINAEPPFVKKEPTFMRVVSSELMTDEWLRNNVEINTGQRYILAGFRSEEAASQWVTSNY